MRVGKEVSFMPEGKTIGQLMEEMRQKAGAMCIRDRDSQTKGQIKILSHAKVRNGDLLYDRSEQIR